MAETELKCDKNVIKSIAELIINNDDGRRSVDLMQRICENIVRNPTKTKYQSVNYGKFVKQCKANPSFCVNMMLNCGFSKQNNNRLVFNIKHMQRITEFCKHIAIANLVSDGFDINDAIFAITLSNNNKDGQVNEEKTLHNSILHVGQLQRSNQVLRLVATGISIDESIKAIEMSYEPESDNENTNDQSSSVNANKPNQINCYCGAPMQTFNRKQITQPEQYDILVLICKFCFASLHNSKTEYMLCSNSIFVGGDGGIHDVLNTQPYTICLKCAFQISNAIISECNDGQIESLDMDKTWLTLSNINLIFMAIKEQNAISTIELMHLFRVHACFYTDWIKAYQSAPHLNEDLTDISAAFLVIWNDIVQYVSNKLDIKHLGIHDDYRNILSDVHISHPKLKAIQMEWCQLYGNGNGNEDQLVVKLCDHSESCLSIKRTLFVLKLFMKHHISESNDELMISYIFNECLKGYCMQLLLNDFNHILLFHKAKMSFWSLDNIDCNVGDDCAVLERRVSDDDEKKYNKYNNITNVKDKVLIDILDKIHVFINHQFGKKNTFNDNDEKNQHLLSKNINKEQMKYNKFCTEVNDNPQQMGKFTVGKHFAYYKMTPIHSNLKNECLHNQVAPTVVDEWNKLIAKATELKFTIYGKKLISRDLGTGVEIHGILANQPISVSHIAALLLYTDYTKIQYLYKKECRRHKRGDKQYALRERNRRILNWSLLFRQLIFCFGTKVNTKDCFYHGLNKLLLFDSFHANIALPLSTTTNVSTAAAFAQKQGRGIVLKLQCAHGTFSDINRYIDASVFSKYPEEEEMVFEFTNALIIKDVRICKGILEKTNDVYISAMMLLERLFKSQFIVKLWNNQFFMRIQKTLLILINNFANETNSGVPEYIQLLFNNFVSKYEKIPIYIAVTQFHSLNMELQWSILKMQDMLTMGLKYKELSSQMDFHMFMNKLTVKKSNLHFTNERQWMVKNYLSNPISFGTRKRHSDEMEFQLLFRKSTPVNQDLASVGITYKYNRITDSGAMGYFNVLIEEIGAVMDTVIFINNDQRGRTERIICKTEALSHLDQFTIRFFFILRDNSGVLIT